MHAARFRIKRLLALTAWLAAVEARRVQRANADFDHRSDRSLHLNAPASGSKHIQFQPQAIDSRSGSSSRSSIGEQGQRSMRSLAKLLVRSDATSSFNPSAAGIRYPVGSSARIGRRSPRMQAVSSGPVSLEPAFPDFPADLLAQVAREYERAHYELAYAFGFAGACCNWFLGASALIDSKSKSPAQISVTMTIILIIYSLLFARWAGWAVGPRNYVLTGSHIFNLITQSFQLRRAIRYKMANDPEAKGFFIKVGKSFALVFALVTIVVLSRDAILSMLGPSAPSFLNGKGGLLTIHPWPPLTKLAISVNALLQFNRPIDSISLPLYFTLTLTGAIFTLYGLFTNPINYVLSGVNVLLFLSSAYQLVRKIKSKLS